MKLLPLTLATAATAATDLLIPLYQYPLNGGQVWAPIEQALANNPSLNTKIVINPHDGPGKNPNEGINDPEYVAGTKRLGAHANAQMVGYVHTSTDGGRTRCNRPWTELETDIRTWSTWISRESIPIQGIFVDESPLNTNNNCVEYMRNLTDLIRNDPELLFPQRLVIFNPGGTGDLQPFYDLDPTYIIALETCFTVPEKAGGEYDQCDPAFPNWERYDHDGIGSSLDDVVFPNVGRQNAARTAVLVHGFHDYNGASANFTASEEVLGNMMRGVVERGVGATFFNTRGYHAFEDGPASIGVVARLLSEANAGN
ncbi:Spherulation-specific family 4-domain-containing protein [Podospora aff. communis PSN243]|uniref:Spherulation-specific family 4-domain-containing protein n=1 Tax=Podospora aff. communis PSN243 TaxID=3040156 RepID=A0AAV9FYA3_9PEZI|nr:Spherulation-specific family 4-domain-containing protein [Podospora aff. communis PSN243]